MVEWESQVVGVRIWEEKEWWEVVVMEIGG